MAAELTEGSTYLVKATTTNMSTKAGVPVAAPLTINIAAAVNSQVIMEDSEVYGFAADETHTFEFSMAVPMGTGGKAGAVMAEVLDPNGNKLADGSLDVVIAPVTEPWVSPTGHLCEGTSEEDEDWAYLTLAYDRNPDSCAKYRRIFSGWSPWVEFTLPATTSSKLKCLLFKRTAPETISKVKIEVYYSGAYHTEYEADFPIEEWFEVSYTQNSVTKVRFSFYNTTSYRAFPHIYEVQVFDDTA